MNTLSKLSLLITSTLLVSCANQNQIAHEKVAPVINPCQKIDLLIKAYDNNFDNVKETNIAAKASSIWKAKYHLVGDSCQVWSWGGKKTTYACNIIAPDKKTALNYYDKAKTTTQQCLGKRWKMQESPRKSDEGLKTEFTHDSNKLSLSTHLVPTKGLFESQWTVYYYIGNSKL